MTGPFLDLSILSYLRIYVKPKHFTLLLPNLETVVDRPIILGPTRKSYKTVAKSYLAPRVNIFLNQAMAVTLC